MCKTTRYRTSSNRSNKENGKSKSFRFIISNRLFTYKDKHSLTDNCCPCYTKITMYFFNFCRYDIVNAKRRFYIISHGTCSGDHGWLSVTDVGFTADRCPVELGVLPVFLHSSSGADQNLQGRSEHDDM